VPDHSIPPVADAHVDEPLGTGSWASLVDHLADAVLVADRDGILTYWNAAAERIFGWSAAEAVGRSLDLIIPVRLRARHWEGYRQVMEAGVTRYGDTLLEVPALHRDARPLSIAFTLTVVTDPSGRVDRLVAVVRDDTSRWQERRRLRSGLEELRRDPGPTPDTHPS
jgi:PAS domain S-box-containing protein